MNKILTIFIFIFFSACLFPLQSDLNAQEKKAIKIACIGDSITFGATIKDRNNNSFPAQLAELLGDGYIVENYGVSSRTLLKKGDHPYCNEGAYRNSLKFNPDYVFIKLGTNDTKPQNWKYKSEFKADLKELAESFINLTSKPKVIICTPVPVQKDRWGINEKDLKVELKIIKKVAKQLNLTILDLHSILQSNAKYYNDGVHPNREGAAIIAAAMYKMITQKKLPLKTKKTK